MKVIDCCNMDCPAPVIETKKALDELEDNSILEVIVNSSSSVENIKRFAKKLGLEASVEELEDKKSKITIVKGYLCEIPTSNKKSFLNKTILIKSDKVGEGELGTILMHGFLKTLLEFKELPKSIIFVNRGIFLTTQNEHLELIEALKELENRGVEIYSCGLCLNFYKIDTKELKVGEVGNAYDTMASLLENETITF